MKKLLLPILLIFSVTLFGQTDTISETERIIDKYGGEIVTCFNDFVAKATPLAETGFEHVVRLQVAKGTVMLIPLFLFIILLSLLVQQLAYFSTKDLPTDRDGDKNYPTYFYILCAVVGVFGILSAFTIYSGVLHVMAPEWFAIKEIIELLNPKP